MDADLRAAIHDQLLVYKSEVPHDTLAEFAAMLKKDLALCHFGLGLYIRNNYLIPGNRLYKLFVADGVIHKDDMSAVIIREWHKTLRREK